MSDTTWAVTQLSKLLPLDEDSLKQIISHTNTLSPEEAADNFKTLLGDSPQALEFISSFNSRRRSSLNQTTPAQAQASASAPGPSQEDIPAAPKHKRKKKTPFNQLPAVRRPEDHGDVSGAYHKKDSAEEYMPGKHQQARKDATASTFALTSTPAARQAPTPNTLDPSMPNVHSRTASPAKSSRSPRSGVYTPGSTSRTASPKPKKAAAAAAAKVTIQGGAAMHGPSTALNDLESAIRALELSTNPSIPPVDPAVRRCGCMGTTHPVLAAAPNCLSCGKIVCAKEGLAPCTFCATPLLTPGQVQDMVRALREERGREKMAANNAGQKRAELAGAARPFQNAQVEALEKAQAHRDRLLGFQASNAARTKVVDEAASYETPDMGVSQWGSAEQRAGQLRRQQKVLREMEWNARPEWEKRKIVVSVDLVGGKVVRRMADAERPKELDGDGEDEGDGLGLEKGRGQEKGDGGARTAEGGGAFARNPLLGKLIRPKWKSTDEDDDAGKGDGTEDQGQRRRHVPWRRVQDDKDESEEYILNGGAFGREGEVH